MNSDSRNARFLACRFPSLSEGAHWLTIVVEHVGCNPAPLFMSALSDLQKLAAERARPSALVLANFGTKTHLVVGGLTPLEEGVELKNFSATWIGKPAHWPQKAGATFTHHSD